jgi:hypothetical protein
VDCRICVGFARSDARVAWVCNRPRGRPPPCRGPMNPRFGRRPSYSVLLRESEAVAKRLPATASPDLPLPDDGSPASVLRTAR